MRLERSLSSHTCSKKNTTGFLAGYYGEIGIVIAGGALTSDPEQGNRPQFFLELSNASCPVFDVETALW